MRVFRYILSALFVLLLAVPCPAGSSVVQLFSGPAVSVWDLFPKLEDAFREKGSVVQVPSPNGKNKLVFPSGWGEDDTDEYTFFAVNERRRYPIHIDGYVQPHVIWANDSSAALFFLQQRRSELLL